MQPTTNNSTFSTLTKTNNVYISYETTIDGHTVELLASGPENDLCVEFFVDDSHRRKDLPKATSMKITRFLRTAWVDLEPRSTMFYCDPVDGRGGWRERMFVKLGFKYSSSEQVFVLTK